MKNLLLKNLGLGAILLFAIGCTKEKELDTAALKRQDKSAVNTSLFTTVDSYVAAQYYATNSNNTFRYWINTQTPIQVTTSATYSTGEGIAISGSDLYFIGNEGPTVSSPRIPKYWKNGTSYNLNLPAGCSSATPRKITISGGNVYICGAGYFGTGAAAILRTILWVNNVPTVIGAASYNTSAWDICVSGSNVYIAGNKNSTTAVYWLNGTEYTLHNSPVNGNPAVPAIAVLGNDVYIAVASGSITSAEYKVWKNGVVQTNFIGGPDKYMGEANLVVSGSDIYFSCFGDFNSNPSRYSTTYVWKNSGTPIQQIAGFQGARSGLAVSSQGDIIIAGRRNAEVNLWRNGAEIQLSTPGNGGVVHGIALKEY